jgi:hypothetical protein
MLRTLFTLGIVAVLGLIALKVVFGLLGPLVGLLMILLGLALKIGLVLLLIYVVIRIVSPGTAAGIRSKFKDR